MADATGATDHSLVESGASIVCAFDRDQHAGDVVLAARRLTAETGWLPRFVHVVPGRPSQSFLPARTCRSPVGRWSAGRILPPTQGLDDGRRSQTAGSYWPCRRQRRSGRSWPLGRRLWPARTHRSRALCGPRAAGRGAFSRRPGAAGRPPCGPRPPTARRTAGMLRRPPARGAPVPRDRRWPWSRWDGALR